MSNSASFSVHPRIVLNAFDNPIVVWHEDIGGYSFEVHLSRWDGSAWTKMDDSIGYDNIASGTIDHLAGPEITLDSSNYPIVVWRTDHLSSEHLVASRWNGFAWTQMDGVTSGNEIVSMSSPTYGDVAKDVHLAYLSDGRILVGWNLETPSSLHVTFWNGTDWVDANGDPGNDNLSGPIRVDSLGIVISTDDVPYVVWEERDDYNDIYFSHLDTFIVSPATIQSTNITGSLNENVFSATLSANDSTPGASSIEYFLSNNGGNDWFSVDKDELFIFSTTGDDLRWKAVLTSEESSLALSSVDISYSLASSVDGVCGSSSTTYASTDTSFSGSLCATGTASPLSPLFPSVGSSVSWDCVGSGGGVTDSCSALRNSSSTPLSGVCGDAAQNYDVSDSSFSGSFCSVGVSFPSVPLFPSKGDSTSWTCQGLDGGGDTDCHASQSSSDTTKDVDLLSTKDVTQTSVILRVRVNDEYDGEKLDFRVRVTNEDTGEKHTVKLTKKTSDNGRATLVIDDLLPGTNYSFRVKFSEEDKDDFSAYSKKLPATTLPPTVSLASSSTTPSYDTIDVSEDTEQGNDSSEEENTEEQNNPSGVVTSPVIPPAIDNNTSETNTINTIEKTFLGSVLEQVSRIFSSPDHSLIASPVIQSLVLVVPTLHLLMIFIQIPLKNIGSVFFSLMNIISALKRRAQYSWGLVFDAQTGQPVSSALVTVTSTTGRSQTIVSNAYGMYGMLVPKGTYTVSVSRDQYTFPVAPPYVHIRPKHPVSLGEVITFDQPSLLFHDLPLSVSRSKRTVMGILRDFFSAREGWMIYTLFFFYVIGFILSLYIFATLPTFVHFLFVLLYIIVGLLRLLGFFANRPYWGSVINNKTKRPIPFVQVKLFSTNDTLEARGVTDQQGRYYLFAKPGTYTLVTEHVDRVTGQTQSSKQRVSVSHRGPVSVVTETVRV